jgi:hypothetical protein
MKQAIIPLILEQVSGITVGMVNIVIVSGAGGAAVAGVSPADINNTIRMSEYFVNYTSIRPAGSVGHKVFIKFSLMRLSCSK